MLGVVLVMLLGACAWTRRENRPVWNAFEQHLVPESPTAFVVALPVTVPLGVVSILVDTFVAHPLQVVDDAFVDSTDVWWRTDFEHTYYTDAGLVPLRLVAVPIWFAGAFLGRSMFAFESTAARETRQAQRHQRTQERARAETLSWLRRIAYGADETARGPAPEALDDELRATLQRAFAQGTALGRLRLYSGCADEPVLAAAVDWLAGLADPSAVVRFRVLQVLPDGVVVVPDELRRRLQEDADEAVQRLAIRLWTEPK
jgi:hypothetical protein